MAELPGRRSIVVVGAGFGGLEVAKALADSDVRVTVVDRMNHHCFQPLLYQVATASLSPADIAWLINRGGSGKRTCSHGRSDGRRHWREIPEKGRRRAF